MIYEERYEELLGACRQITSRRQKLAKPKIEEMIVKHIGVDVPNEDLLSHLVSESLLKRIDKELLESKNIYIQQFDIPQAALHLSNFAHRHLPERALILINLPPSQFQIRLLIFGLIGVSGMIYAGLWLSLGQGDHNPLVLQRGAMVGFEKGHWEGERDVTLLGKKSALSGAKPPVGLHLAQPE